MTTQPLATRLRIVLLTLPALVLGACAIHDGDQPGTSIGDLTGAATLLVSTSPTRSAPKLLAGAALTGSVYIFTSDSTKTPNPVGVKQVRYWLDDTAMSGAPTHVENYTPYDFVGTAANGTAEAWNTAAILHGSHTITESVIPTSGAAETYSTTFTVGMGGGDPGDAGGGGGNDGGGRSDAGGGADASVPPSGCPASAVSLGALGSAGNGGNDTAVIQNAIKTTASQGKSLRIPVASHAYNVDPLTVPSHADICVDSGVTFEATTTYGAFDVMWTISGATDVQLLGYGATFHQAKSIWANDSDPEYRHCLAVVGGSSNVTVGGFTCSTFGGDGIYLGGNSSNVTVEDVTADGCARDGLTVISAKNSTVKGCHFINGHTGVDMEPNVATDALDGVTLQDSFTTNNNWGGVNVSIYAYNSSTTPLNVTVLRHTDENTGAGVTAFDGASSFSANGTNGVATSGALVFDTCTSINAGSRAAWIAWWTANGPSVTFKNLTITNANQNGLTAVDGAAIAVGRGGGGVGDQGNSTFTGTSVTATNGKIQRYFTYYDGSGFPFSNVKWIDPGTLSGATMAPPNGLFNGTGVNTVNQ